MNKGINLEKVGLLGHLKINNFWCLKFSKNTTAERLRNVIFTLRNVTERLRNVIFCKHTKKITLNIYTRKIY